MREHKSGPDQISPGGARHGERKSGMEMTDDRARESRRQGRTCEEATEEVRGWGLKRRADGTGGEERRSDGTAIIIGYENLAVTSAPLLAWCYSVPLHLFTPPPEPVLFFLDAFKYPGQALYRPQKTFAFLV